MITNDQIAEIMTPPHGIGVRPRGLRMSPDGKCLAFLWSDADSDKLSLHTWTPSGLHCLGDFDGYSWSGNCDLLVWKGAELKKVSAAGETHQVWPPFEYLILDSRARGEAIFCMTDRVIYECWQNGYLEPILIAGPSEQIRARVQRSDGDLLTFGQLHQYNWISNSGRYLAATTWVPKTDVDLMIPRFTELGGLPLQHDFRIGTYSIRILDLTVRLSHLIYLPDQARLYNIDWSKQDDFVVFDYVLSDRCSRIIEEFSLMDFSQKIIYSECAPVWHGALAKFCQIGYAGTNLLFSSEKDGKAALYKLSKSGETHQITMPDGELKWAKQDFDGRIYFTRFDEPTGSLLLEVAGSAGKLPLGNEIQLPGSCVEVEVEHGHVGAVTTALTGGCKLHIIRVPDQQTTILDTLRDPDLVRSVVPRLTLLAAVAGDVFPSRRAMEYLPRPEVANRAGILFVHGNGYVQDIFKGHHPYYWREHLFNRILAKIGYTVISVDYAGSEGYGPHFANSIYRRVPELEISDLLLARDRLIELGCHGNRIGLYGGSYGGYLVIMAILLRPNLFTCGAALRAVTDWREYWRADPLFTEQRFGNDLSDQRYDQASALGKCGTALPRLLLLHGAADDNVTIFHLTRFIADVQRNKLGSNLDVMIYPDEAHSFKSPSNWSDEYRRILEFFGDSLL